MKLFNLFKKSHPMIGKDLTWKESIRKVFKVIGFDRNGTIISEIGEVKAKSMFRPYGYLDIEAPQLAENMKLPIIHKNDFSLALSVFDDKDVVQMLNKFELLVTYVPKDYHPQGLAGTSHALHYVLTPKGTLENYYEKSKSNSNIDIENLFIEFIWTGEIKVQLNTEPEF